MAALSPIREVLACRRCINVVHMPDPRTDDGESLDWLWQHQLESLLYRRDYRLTNGAFYRLLGRSAAGNGRALPLKKKSVTDGLLSDAQFVQLRDVIHPGCRSITLVPIDALEVRHRRRCLTCPRHAPLPPSPRRLVLVSGGAGDVWPNA